MTQPEESALKFKECPKIGPKSYLNSGRFCKKDGLAGLFSSVGQNPEASKKNSSDRTLFCGGPIDGAFRKKESDPNSFFREAPNRGRLKKRVARRGFFLGPLDFRVSQKKLYRQSFFFSCRRILAPTKKTFPFRRLFLRPVFLGVSKKNFLFARTFLEARDFGVSQKKLPSIEFFFSADEISASTRKNSQSKFFFLGRGRFPLRPEKTSIFKLFFTRLQKSRATKKELCLRSSFHRLTFFALPSKKTLLGAFLRKNGPESDTIFGLRPAIPCFFSKSFCYAT